MISQLKLLFRSFTFYWKSNLLVSLGAAISTMVLTGALIIGDSVKTSLLQTAELRLGRTDYVFRGIDRYFRAELARALRKDLNSDIAPVLHTTGVASSQGGAMKLSGINVWGIDDQFSKMAENQHWRQLPEANEVWISSNLANRLRLRTGDPLLLRLDKADPIPKNAPFVSETDRRVSVRLTVGQILGPEQLGHFNLKASQTAPFNAFISLSNLNGLMGTDDLANMLLFAGHENVSRESIMKSVLNHWSLKDAGLSVQKVNDGTQWEIRSSRVFIEQEIAEAVKTLDPSADLILTYFANSIQKDSLSTPYSFVSAGSFISDTDHEDDSEILINDWLANDLNAGPGDSILIKFFVIGPLRRLEEQKKWFRVKAVVPIGSPYDQTLMPSIPGLTDAGNCRDWETGVPVDLDEIREKDESYWNEWKGTPKAYINYDLGKSLWENRFGIATSIRLSGDKSSSREIEKNLAKLLPPSKFGFGVDAVKDDGMHAARNGVDFSQLFIGLSFFILMAGLSLLALLFNLHIEKRTAETGTLRALGFSKRMLQRQILLEGVIIAIPGVIIGGILGIMYNRLVFSALQTRWQDIVRTTILQVDIRWSTLVVGMCISLILILFTIWINVRRKLKQSATQLQKGFVDAHSGRILFWFKVLGMVLGIIALIILAKHWIGDSVLNTGAFFGAGGLLLLSLLFWSASITLGKKKTSDREYSLFSFAFDNIHRNGPRSLRIIILFALGTFVVISTGLNRKDLHTGSLEQSSGTGGFLFYGETTMPVLADLNEKEVRIERGLDLPMQFVQMRKTDGDDASCLNLNRVTQPGILGVPSEKLNGRFSFVRQTDELDTDKPWLSLKKKLSGDLIPAIADQTVIQWGLGKKVGDTLVYHNAHGERFTLKLIGGIANSIFQGSMLIDESHFLQQFPFSSGTQVFLAEGASENGEESKEILERVFRNDGLELTFTADRLATFNRIEDTYLSIFLLLGGLGMILGAIGLGITLARNILDRRKELAILKSMGYKTRTILALLTGEHIFLLGLGTLIGAGTAVIATLPSLMSLYVEASWKTALLIITLIVINGLAWTLVIGKSSLRKNLLESLRTE